jgi:acyl-CoA thioesterase-2
MADSWDDLRGCLELRQHESAAGGSAFEGRSQRLSYHRIFGGQLLGQFVRAAALSCPTKTVKSLHVLFPAAGRTDEPVRYDLTRHREGGTFATLTGVARQAAGVLATAAVSMHAAEDGPCWQAVAALGPVPGAAHRLGLDLIPWETRSTADLDAPAAATPEFELWMRLPPVAAELAPALTAYATDLTLIGTALRPVEGVGQRDAGSAFTSAVTSHTLWFHRPIDPAGWLLLRQHSPVLAHGRCFGRGDVLTEDGALVASYAQEALLRFPTGPPEEPKEPAVRPKPQPRKS